MPEPSVDALAGQACSATVPSPRRVMVLGVLAPALRPRFPDNLARACRTRVVVITAHAFFSFAELVGVRADIDTRATCLDCALLK